MTPKGNHSPFRGKKEHKFKRIVLNDQGHERKYNDCAPENTLQQLEISEVTLTTGKYPPLALDGL